jgi:hypothetical protein
LNSTPSLIISISSLTGNITSLASGNSISDFVILKQFKVSIHHPKAPSIVEVIWSPSLDGWVKCNTDALLLVILALQLVLVFLGTIMVPI